MRLPMSATTCYMTGITRSVRSSATATSDKTSMRSAAIIPCRRGSLAIMQTINKPPRTKRSSRRTRPGNRSGSASRRSPRYGIASGSTAMSPTCRMPNTAGSTPICCGRRSTYYPQDGTGRGVQTELILTYLSPKISNSASADATGRCGPQAPDQSCHGSCDDGLPSIAAGSIYRPIPSAIGTFVEMSYRFDPHRIVLCASDYGFNREPRSRRRACATASGPLRRRRRSRRARHS